MRAGRSLAALLLLACSAASAAAQQSVVCKVTRTIVESDRSVLLRCDEISPSLPPAAELHIVKDSVPGDPRVSLEKIADVRIEAVPEGKPRWWRVRLPAGGPLLAPGNRYFLHLPLAAGAAGKAFWHEVSTGFEAAITDSPASIDSGRVLALAAGVALQAPGTVSLVATKDGVEQPIPATFRIAEPAPVRNGADPSTIGRAEIIVSGFRLPTGKVKLTVTGLQDVFGKPVSTAAKARTEILGRKLSGRTKDEVGTYIKFGHQAGRKTEPVWTVDSKVAVELPQRSGGWRVTPTAAVDVGFGPSKSANTIKLGVAFTRFDLLVSGFENPRESLATRDGKAIQGVRVSVAPTFETDRDFTKRNLIADVDGELFFAGFYNPIQKQNRRRLEAARVKTPGIEMDEVPGARFGWAITTNAGLEVGRTLDDHEKTFQTGSGDTRVSTTVVAESHNILRLRPRLGILLELWKVSLSIQGTGRFLLAKEQGLIEANKTFSWQEFEDWQGYGEVTLSIPLSPRTSIDSTWKNGRQPPLYQRINVVQTGLAFRF